MQRRWKKCNLTKKRMSSSLFLDEEFERRGRCSTLFLCSSFLHNLYQYLFVLVWCFVSHAFFLSSYLPTEILTLNFFSSKT